MSVISFQGVCYFERVGGRVVVHLPAGDGHAVHLDDTRANPHHAAIFIRDDLLIDHEGFRQCSFEPGEEREAVSGWYFPLSDFGSPRGLAVRLSRQGRDLDLDDLDEHLISFSDIFGRDKAPRPTPGAAAAYVVIEGGTLGCERDEGTNVEWEVDVDGGGIPKHPAWRVDWHTGAPTGTTVRLSIENSSREVIAWAHFTAGSSDPNGIIIGNLDDANPARWPLREDMPLEECEDVDGRRSRLAEGADGKGAKAGHLPCYDNDFKWLYRLFDLEKLTKNNGKFELPVPRMKNGQAFINPGGGSAAGTPTCFPGGD